MNHLPARLLLSELILIDLHVLGEDLLQDAHQDDGQEGREQQHEHEGVDDGEPAIGAVVPSMGENKSWNSGDLF